MQLSGKRLGAKEKVSERSGTGGKRGKEEF